MISSALILKSFIASILIIYTSLTLSWTRRIYGYSRSCFYTLIHVVVFTHAEARAHSRTCTYTRNVNVRPCERNRRHSTTTTLQPTHRCTMAGTSKSSALTATATFTTVP